MCIHIIDCSEFLHKEYNIWGGIKQVLLLNNLTNKNIPKRLYLVGLLYIVLLMSRKNKLNMG